MTTYGMVGLPAGSSDLSATLTSGATTRATGTDTPTVTTRSDPTEPIFAVVQKTVVNPNFRGFDVVSENWCGNGSQFFQLRGAPLSFEAPLYNTVVRGGAGTGTNRFFPTTSDEINRFFTFGDGAFNGGTARIYRVRDGAFSMVRESTITDWAVRMWTIETRSSNMLPPAAATNGRRISYDLCEPGKTLWFAVAPVFTGDVVGPASNAVSWTTVQRTVAAPSNDATISRGSLTYDSGQSTVSDLTIDLEDGGQIAALTWTEVSGALGYLLLSATSEPTTGGAKPWPQVLNPIDPGGHWVDMETHATPVEVGDMMIMSYSYASSTRGDTFHPRHARDNQITDSTSDLIIPASVANNEEGTARTFTRTLHPANTAPTDGGQWYGRIGLEEGEVLDIQRRNFSGTSQVFYAPLQASQTYFGEIYLRSVSGNITAEWEFYDDNANPLSTGFTLSAPTITLTSEWQLFRTTLTVPEDYTGDQERRLGVRITGGTGGGVIDADGFRVGYDGTAFGDYTTLEYDRHYQNGVTAIRSHEFIKSGAVGNSYDLEQITNPPGAVHYHRSKGATLPGFLDRCLGDGRGKFTPWLQLEYYLTPAEWLGLIEYLAAPWVDGVDSAGTKPWAYKRAVLQGRTAPWITEWDEFIFELGNENWNSLPGFQPWTTVDKDMLDGEGNGIGPGQLHGLMTQWVIDIFKSSPYWSTCESRMKFALGCWRPNPANENTTSFTRSAALACPGAHLLTTAAYNGGQDEGQGAVTDTPVTYEAQSNFMLKTTQVSVKLLKEIVAEANAARVGVEGAVTLSPGVYEAGPGYNESNNNEETETVKKSLSNGACTLDNFAYMTSNGYQRVAFFRLPEQGGLWTAVTSIVDGLLPWPAFSCVGEWSAAARGLDLVNVRLVNKEGRDITDDLSIGQRVPRVGVYAALGGGSLALALVSRTLPYTTLDPGDPLYSDPLGMDPDDGSTQVQLYLPITGASGVTLRRLSGDYDSGWTIPPQFADVAVSVPSPATRMTVTVPPAATMIYKFTGVTG